MAMFVHKKVELITSLYITSRRPGTEITTVAATRKTIYAADVYPPA